MRIPIIDHLVEQRLSAQPKRVRYVVEVPLEIKAGRRSAKVEIPCSLTAIHFSISFPQGLEYVYGDEHNEGKTEEVEAHPDPSIQVSLPDIADTDLKIPISLGFAHNPLSLSQWFMGWATISTLTLLFAWGAYLSGPTVWSLLPLSITAILVTWLLVQIRTYQRLRAALSKYSTRLL